LNVEDFVFLCKEYGLAKDEQLTAGAKRLKYRILEHVKGFQDEGDGVTCPSCGNGMFLYSPQYLTSYYFCPVCGFKK
jgi:hypothetical protein